MENQKYYLKNISFSYLKNGRYLGDDEYEMEVRFKNNYNESYKRYFTIFYDEEDSKKLKNNICWHCNLPFLNNFYKATYLDNDFHLLKFQEKQGYVCKTCYFFLNLYDYNRDYIFRCASCGLDFNIIFGNAFFDKCQQSYFDAYKDILCIKCSNYYVLNQKYG